MFGSPSDKVVATLVVSPQDVIQPTQDHSFLTAAWKSLLTSCLIEELTLTKRIHLSEHKAQLQDFGKTSLKGGFFFGGIYVIYSPKESNLHHHFNSRLGHVQLLSGLMCWWNLDITNLPTLSFY